MPHYIYSTHTNPVDYVEYEKNINASHNVIKKGFSVAGGHGMCNKNFITLEGVPTRVDKDEDMEWLYGLKSFQDDIEKGFIRVSKRKEESEKVVRRDMCTRDGSAPILPTDYKKTETGHFTYTKNNPLGNIRI